MNGDGYSRDSGRSRDHYGSRHDRDDRRDRGGDRENRDRRGDRDRRRSRSPHQRSRRDFGEVDSYSSSREYRAREREDRYGGDRRGDRPDWNRERGGGRRRDDDRQGQGRRGDLFEDRRGGRRDDNRRGREERDEFAQQARGGRSPPPKKREPTPDLTDITSILGRKRRLTQWDIKPPGYENVTAEQAKMSGMFPLPGAPRQQQMDPSKLQAFINQPQGAATTQALKPSTARQSKRLFVFNVAPNTSESDIIEFFNLQMNGLNVVTNIDPCVSASLPSDKKFALVEFKSAIEATVALALDGITMPQHLAEVNGSGGAPAGLDIKRPKDYIVPAAEDDEYTPGDISTVVPDSANKICVSNIPSYLTEEQIIELLNSFGEQRAFSLVKDNGTGESRGIAFCEYKDPSSTNIAIEGLNGMELGDAKLKVVRASIGFTQASGLEMGVSAMSMFAGTQSGDVSGGRVIQLLNMVTAEELIDNDDYEEICEDVQEECSKYGTIVELKIPRPSGGSRQSAGVGKIFIKYDTPESAKTALEKLAGRKFADRTVVTTYFDEASFDVSAW